MSAPSTAQLAELRAELERTAPPGWVVVDVFPCRDGHCDDVHAIVLPPGPELRRADRAERGARRRRVRG